MEPGTSGTSGTNYPIPRVQTFEAFTDQKTSCVRAALEKAIAFGFNVEDVILGYKMKFIQDSRPHSYTSPSGQHFIFKELQKKQFNIRKHEVIKTYLKPATMENFKKSSDLELAKPKALIDKAFAYDEFIRIKAKELSHTESFDIFLARVDDNRFFYSTFLQQIANAMNTKPEINPKEDGEYLLALWIELSNAMAMQLAGQSNVYSNDPLNWSRFTQRAGQNTHNSDIDSQMQPSSSKKLRKDTLDTPFTTYPENLTRESDIQKNEDHPGVENFVDLARLAGRSIAEVTLEKASFLANQAKNNLTLLLQQETETGQKVTSEEKKRELIKTLCKALETANELKTNNSH